MDRLLKERDEARDAGDQLAKSVAEALSVQNTDFTTLQASLRSVLKTYCEKTGWNGPAGSWVKNPPF